MAFNAKKNIKNFSSEQLLPQASPESDVPGLEYLDTHSPGHPFSGPGRYSTDRSAFVVVICTVADRLNAQWPLSYLPL